jgi:hypothetical protein
MNDPHKHLQYYLLSARQPLHHQIELHDKVFKFWLSIWKPTLAELGYNDSHLHDDFIRQDLISCICHKDQVVGVVLFSFYSLGPLAVMDFRYMKDNFNDLFFKKIKKFGVRSVMSMQYVAVHPDWRGRKNPTAPPITALLTALANKVRDLYNIDAGIAPIRRDYNTTAASYEMGADCIMEKIKSHNTECDLVASIRRRTFPHPNPEIQNLVEHLWDNHINSVQDKPVRPLKVA